MAVRPPASEERVVAHRPHFVRGKHAAALTTARASALSTTVMISAMVLSTVMLAAMMFPAITSIVVSPSIASIRKSEDSRKSCCRSKALGQSHLAQKHTSD